MFRLGIEQTFAPYPIELRSIGPVKRSVGIERIRMMKYRLLRLLLFVAAFAWAVSAAAVVLPWPAAVVALNGLGAGSIPNDPMLDYWLRMAAGAFTGVGVFFFIVGLWPSRFKNVIGLIAALMFFEGIVLLIHGLRLGLNPFPFYADTMCCLLVGGGIFLLRNAEREIPTKVRTVPK